MAHNFANLECAISNESLLDPRALPCGHSYCGPPRKCLTAMENSQGGLCCAICRTDHNLKADDIKPLYGIRDYFPNSLGKTAPRRPRIPCSMHKNLECTFWCNSCNVMICVSCFEPEHDGHSVRSLKTYLVGQVESIFGAPFRQRISEWRESLEKLISFKKSQFEEVEKDLKTAQKLRDEIDDCLKVETMTFPRARMKPFCSFNYHTLKSLK